MEKGTRKRGANVKGKFEDNKKRGDEIVKK
jgi:hypothetical protein